MISQHADGPRCKDAPIRDEVSLDSARALTRSAEFENRFEEVVRRPLDFVPRQKLADWLEYNGDPLWAELVRDRSDSNRMAHGSLTGDFGREPRTRALRDRIGNRIREFGESLIRGLGDVSVHVVGGLPGYIFGEPNSLARIGQKIADRLPVTSVCLKAWPGEQSLRAGSPLRSFFRTVDSLAVAPNRSSRERRHTSTATLSRLGELPELRALVLPGNSITDAGIGFLADLKNLSALDVRENGLSSDGLRTLTSFADLRQLDLSFNPISEDCGEVLPALTRLEYLNLRGTGLEVHAGQFLDRMPSLGRVIVGSTAFYFPLRDRFGDRVA